MGPNFPDPSVDVEGEGLGSGLRHQETMGCVMAQIRSEGALIQSIDPPLLTGKELSDQHYIVLPLWSSISSTFKSSDDKAADDKPRDDTELKNRDLDELCGMKGIKKEYSNARTPQQNRVAERKKKTLIKVTPKLLHLYAVKRIFSDYAGANLERKSTTGGCQFFGKRLISWQCKKQIIIATSTTEAQYVAAANCYGQVLWIQNQMIDYGFNFMNTKIYIDNESTFCIVKNPLYHSKTKHIEIKNHFIRDSYEKKHIQVLKIHTDDNVADLSTKSFDVSRFNFLKANIGMLNL
nr:putative ribonuclease H-like domain-containing protein [Tanacetum cinerariifolium]